MSVELNQQTSIFFWTDIGRARFIYLFSCVLQLIPLFMLAIIDALPNTYHLINIEHIAHYRVVAVIFCLMTMFMVVAGTSLNRHEESFSRRLYVQLGLYSYQVTQIIVIVMIGVATMPTGILLSGSIMLTLILFGQKAAVRVLLFSLTVVVMLSVLCSTGVMPYAYMLPDGSNDTYSNPVWATFELSQAWIHGFFLLYLAKALTNSWAVREESVVKMSITDALTGCYNRRQLLDSAEEAFTECIEKNQSISMIMVDIDFFKAINDTYGHDTGDEALRYIADKLKKNIRSIDVLSRYGGEEFCIFMKNCTADTTRLVAERCRIQIQYGAFLADDTNSISMTASFGLASVTSQEIGEFNLTPYDMICMADQALYEAKRSGRNKYVMTSIDQFVAT